MERRDYLMRYFEQLGFVLARLLGLQDERRFSEAFQLIDEALKDMLNAPIDEWLMIPENTFLPEITERLSTEQQHVLSELLFEHGEFLYLKGEKEMSKKSYNRSLLLFNYLAETEKTFSIERMNKIDQMMKKLAE